jgi:hypothetical protein
LDMSRSSGEWLQIHNLLATSKKIWYCRELWIRRQEFWLLDHNYPITSNCK